jgi:hypothetical protein
MHGFGGGKYRSVEQRLDARLGRQDKANFVRASLRLQEFVCTLFFAARSYPTSEARRRFFRFFIAINVPRDGGSPLLRQGTQIQSVR